MRVLFDNPAIRAAAIGREVQSSGPVGRRFDGLSAPDCPDQRPQRDERRNPTVDRDRVANACRGVVRSEPVSRTVLDPSEIAVSIDGGIASDVADYARVKVAEALVHVQVSTAAVNFLRGGDQAHRVIATASVGLADRPIHVRVAATSEWAAVDLLVAHILRRVASPE